MCLKRKSVEEEEEEEDKVNVGEEEDERGAHCLRRFSFTRNSIRKPLETAGRRPLGPRT